MTSNEKTFRYSQIQSLGVFYLMFLFVCVVAGLFVGIREFMFFAFLIGVGVVLLVLFLTTSVKISDSGITRNTLLGKKSLLWSDIRHVSSQGSSIKLHNRDGTRTLSINPRMDGSAEIFALLYSKRPDLFSIKKNNPLLRNYRSDLTTLTIGVLLVILSLLLYARISYLDMTLGLLGLGYCGLAAYRWYSSPRKITLENNCLVVNYVNRSYSVSADEIADIQILKTRKNQLRSVAVISPDKKVIELSGFKQSPFIVFPVLSKWHQIYAKSSLFHPPDRRQV